MPDWEKVDLDGPIDGCKTFRTFEFFPRFSQAADALPDEQKDQAAAYRFLGQACFMHLKPGDRAQPYGSVMAVGNERTLIATDFFGEDAAGFTKAATRVKNPLLRSRLADIAWLNNKKNAEIGIVAIRSYIESAKTALETQSENDVWEGQSEAVTFLHRALEIARMMGRIDEDPDGLLAAIRNAWATVSKHGMVGLVKRCGQIANAYDNVGKADVANRLEEIAREMAAVGDPIMAHDAAEMAAGYYRANGDAVGEERCHILAVDILEKLIDTDIPAMNKAHWLQTAIHILRPIRTMKERQTRLRAKLREVQPEIMNEMGQIRSPEFDVSEMQEEAGSKVRGKDLLSALNTLIGLVHSPDPKSLADEAMALARQSPITAMFASSSMDEDGRTINKSSGIDLDNPTPESLKPSIARNEGIRLQFAVNGALEPARRQITTEHAIFDENIADILRASPFIPQGHEAMFVKGISAFLNGDNITAAHLLFPQLENSLRYILMLRKVDVTSIKSDMTEELVTLSVLFEKFRPDLESAMGVGLTSDLERLFHEPHGPKLRHRLAHGLVASGMAFHPAVFYGCWLILKLCLLTINSWGRVKLATVDTVLASQNAEESIKRDDS